ncbi:MAG: helix-turn-helix transcriptional regulator, partial [Rhodospirillales bacterium]
DDRTLEQFADDANASARTLARLFRSETNMSFGAWRQQLRLLEAVRRMAGGAPITTVALDLGYDSPSAFAAMFRKTLGVPPSRYFGPAQ